MQEGPALQSGGSDVGRLLGALIPSCCHSSNARGPAGQGGEGAGSRLPLIRQAARFARAAHGHQEDRRHFRPLAQNGTRNQRTPLKARTTPIARWQCIGRSFALRGRALPLSSWIERHRSRRDPTRHARQYTDLCIEESTPRLVKVDSFCGGDGLQ